MQYCALTERKRHKRRDRVRRGERDRSVSFFNKRSNLPANKLDDDDSRRWCLREVALVMRSLVEICVYSRATAKPQTPWKPRQAINKQPNNHSAFFRSKSMPRGFLFRVWDHKINFQQVFKISMQWKFTQFTKCMLLYIANNSTIHVYFLLLIYIHTSELFWRMLNVSYHRPQDLPPSNLHHQDSSRKTDHKYWWNLLLKHIQNALKNKNVVTAVSRWWFFWAVALNLATNYQKKDEHFTISQLPVSTKNTCWNIHHFLSMNS